MNAYDSIERGAADECEPLRGRRPRTFTLTQLLVACGAVCGCTLAATTAVNTHLAEHPPPRTPNEHPPPRYDDRYDGNHHIETIGCQANLEKAEMQMRLLLKKAEMQIEAAAQTEVDDLKKPIDDLATTLRDMQGKRESAVKRGAREQGESLAKAAAQTEADDLKKPIDAMAAILKNMQGVAESAVKRSHEDIQLSSGFNIKPGYQADRGPRNADPKFPNGEWHEHGE